MDGRRRADVAVTTFGIRTIAYHSDRGFLLNGRRVKMRGVNLHHEAGALGAAVPEGVWKRRLELLKQMGVNAIRTAHNPPAREFLHLADRMGFLVMDEAFDEWTIGKVPEGYHKHFAEWSERDVTDFVRRDRNHGRALGAGNEIGGRPSRGGGVLATARHPREDPTRPVPPATTTSTPTYPPRSSSSTDIVGYN
jgi:beta-galactosidase